MSAAVLLSRCWQSFSGSGRRCARCSDDRLLPRGVNLQLDGEVVAQPAVQDMDFANISSQTPVEEEEVQDRCAPGWAAWLVELSSHFLDET